MFLRIWNRERHLWPQGTSKPKSLQTPVPPASLSNMNSITCSIVKCIEYCIQIAVYNMFQTHVSNMKYFGARLRNPAAHKCALQTRCSLCCGSLETKLWQVTAFLPVAFRPPSLQSLCGSGEQSLWAPRSCCGRSSSASSSEGANKGRSFIDSTVVRPRHTYHIKVKSANAWAQNSR